MSPHPLKNRQIRLASRPKGRPAAGDFRLTEEPVPKPGPGQVLLQTRYLSLDPYMRGRMSEGPSYTAPVDVGDVMVGQTVSSVLESKNPDYREGDLVLSGSGWQEYALSGGADLTRLEAGMKHPSYALGVLGMPGFTAYMGLMDIGRPQPGETVAVAAATGPVGSTVGQVARIKGCRAIGIAGGTKKCRYAVEELGFSECIDHHGPDFPKRLKEACPEGIDVYFENVGGAVFEAVLPLLNSKARIPLCGLVSFYNAERLPKGPDRTPLLMRTLLIKRIRLQGFIIFQDYADRFEEFYKTMLPWVQAGRVKVREDVVEGLENAPEAFIGQLEGKNFGKLVVKVSE